jgi:uncharacterized protein (DUF1697 family)
MSLRIALLRGINVGGNKMVAMSDLRDIATRLGFEEPRTLLQSGNLVFRSAKKPAQIEKLLEAEVDAKVFVRTCEEWREVVARNPFPDEAKSDPGHLLLMSFRETVRAFDWPGSERMRADGRHLYIYYPDGAGRSKLTNALIERKSGGSGTARNWNTVLKLAALCVS